MVVIFVTIKSEKHKTKKRIHKVSNYSLPISHSTATCCWKTNILLLHLTTCPVAITFATFLCYRCFSVIAHKLLVVLPSYNDYCLMKIQITCDVKNSLKLAKLKKRLLKKWRWFVTNFLALYGPWSRRCFTSIILLVIGFCI